jgi:predicted SprT family Zn-dependent metalloprotease
MTANLQIPYVYDCKGQEVELTDSDLTEVERGTFYIKCDKCCNIPVYHSLRRNKS